MDITVYNKETGKIIKTLSGDIDVELCLDASEGYVDGIYPLTGSIVQGSYVDAYQIFPEYPANEIQDLYKYADNDTTLLYAIQNIDSIAVEDRHKVLRRMFYPPEIDYNDAIVKINSGDTATVEKGKQELAEYCDSCMAVKHRFPKQEI